MKNKKNFANLLEVKKLYYLYSIKHKTMNTTETLSKAPQMKGRNGYASHNQWEVDINNIWKVAVAEGRNDICEILSAGTRNYYFSAEQISMVANWAVNAKAPKAICYVEKFDDECYQLTIDGDTYDMVVEDGDVWIQRNGYEAKTIGTNLDEAMNYLNSNFEVK